MQGQFEPSKGNKGMGYGDGSWHEAGFMYEAGLVGSHFGEFQPVALCGQWLHTEDGSEV